jgi:elongation factor 1-alpha
MAEGKKHVGIIIVGHVDAGKSTTTGRLLFEFGGYSDRDIAKYKEEAKAVGKDSFFFAFIMDKSVEERKRGVTISCTTKEFFTDNYHYTIIDAPGHRDFIKNMISGASQADVALLMVPANKGGFETAIQKGGNGAVKGQTRHHAELCNLLGINQIMVGVNKMDEGSVKYDQGRYKEIAENMRQMLKQTGWKTYKTCPVIPLSGWVGDNITSVSDKMPWWKGYEDGDKKGNTLKDALNTWVDPPKRQRGLPFRMPVSGVYKIKGVGDVITGRVEQGLVTVGAEVVFLPTHTASKACTGKIFSVEMHHKTVPQAAPGDNVGLNVKGLEKLNMPRVGDVMINKADTTLKACGNFTAQVQILDHPGELKVGYSPIAFIRTGRSAARIAKINWKIGKETGGAKAPDPVSLKANEMAEIVFEPQQPFVCEGFKSCEGLGRVAILEGASVVMLGKCVAVEFKADEKKK